MTQNFTWNWPEIDPKFDPKLTEKFHRNSTQNWQKNLPEIQPKIDLKLDPKLIRNWPKIIPKLTRNSTWNWPEIWLGIQPEIDPKFDPKLINNNSPSSLSWNPAFCSLHIAAPGYRQGDTRAGGWHLDASFQTGCSSFGMMYWLPKNERSLMHWYQLKDRWRPNALF
jgi:hypothetical protein